MRKDYRGISLIEVLVVLAILAILSTGSIGIYQAMGCANTRKVAVYINDAMSKARIDTLSKKDRKFIYLYQIDGKLYSMVTIDGGLSLDPDGGLDNGEGTYLSSNINLSYKTDSEEIQQLEDNEMICISFLKGSGAFDSYYSEIILESRNNRSTILSIKETGRHWVD